MPEQIYSSLTPLLADCTSTSCHQWHILHQHDFSGPSASIIISNLLMLNLVSMEDIIRQINAAEVLRAIFCGYKNPIFVETDGLDFIQQMW